jgi:hypothetical protein
VRSAKQPEPDPVSSSAITSSIAIEVILPPRVLRAFHLKDASSAPVVIVIAIAPTVVVPIKVSLESAVITISATAPPVILVRQGNGRHRQSHNHRANHCFYRSIHLCQCQHVPSFWNLEEQVHRPSGQTAYRC